MQLFLNSEVTSSHEREAYLQANARDGIQLLVSVLFSLPTLSSPEGPLAQLPAPTAQLPRAKPLPKPKPPTKWERFARAKGIHSQRRDRKVWDEESQSWVARWGWKGRNKAEETQWLHEVPANAGSSLCISYLPPFLRSRCLNFWLFDVRCGLRSIEGGSRSAQGSHGQERAPAYAESLPYSTGPDHEPQSTYTRRANEGDRTHPGDNASEHGEHGQVRSHAGRREKAEGHEAQGTRLCTHPHQCCS